MAGDDPILYLVPPLEDGARLDRLVAKASGRSRREARILIAQGRVQVQGRVLSILSRPIREGRRIEIRLDPQALQAPGPPPGDLDILHQDRWLLAINKPAGLLSESDRPQEPSVPAILAANHTQELGRRLWVVHRLDATTSGVMVLARTRVAARKVGALFRDGQVQKTYFALASGRLERRQEVNQPISRAQGKKHVVSRRGKPAATRIDPIQAGDEATLVRCRPRTGRTHQIRVHLEHIGHPLLGDRLYGGPRYTAEVPPRAVARPMLHAATLRLRHPMTGDPLGFRAPPPADFLELTQHLGLTMPADESGPLPLS